MTKAEKLWSKYISAKATAEAYFFELMKKLGGSVDLNRDNPDENLCIFDGEYVECIYDTTIVTTDGCEYYADDLYLCDLINICEFLETYKKGE